MKDRAWIETKLSDKTLKVALGGKIVAVNTRFVDKHLRAINLNQLQSVEIDLSDVQNYDISGTWMIESFVEKLKNHQIPYTINGANENFKAIKAELDKYSVNIEPKFFTPSPILKWLEEVGMSSEKVARNALHMVAFLGQFTLTLLKCLIRPNRIRFVAVAAVINRAGLNALPIVGLISLLVGVVLVYQGAFQLSKFGAEIFTVDLLAVSFLREVGILVTAIVVAGRSGSAFAAQIGTMKLNQEIDALNTFGIDPMEVLVVPRVLALIIVLPLLAFYSNLVGILGGAMMAYVAIDISYNQFFNQLSLALTNWTFWIGIIKAPFFGMAIALTGCFEGMQVEGGAMSVGRKTTKSVVEAIFIVIVIDAAFSILFTTIGI